MWRERRPDYACPRSGDARADEGAHMAALGQERRIMQRRSALQALSDERRRSGGVNVSTSYERSSRPCPRQQ
jgi:hypothetical protein